MTRTHGGKTQPRPTTGRVRFPQQVGALPLDESILHRLEASELRYRRLFETAQDGILILDAKSGRITDVNPYLEAMLGYGHDELTGKKIWEIGPFKDIGLSRGAFLDLQSKGYVRYEHLPLETKDGRQKAVEFISNVYQIDGDSVIQCNIRDITERRHVEEVLALSRAELETRVKERTAQLAKANSDLVREIEVRKQAQQASRESADRFQSLTENISDLVWETDARGVYTYVNRKSAELLGYDPEEMVGKTPVDFVSEEGRSRIVRDFRSIVRSKKPFARWETASVCKDGRVIVRETSGVPFFHADGRIGGYRGIDRDITERRRAEEELQMAERLESISTLAGGIAHDFNNLLAGVLGNISLAERYVERGGKAHDRLIDAEGACLRARDLTQQLLTFSGGGAPVKKPASIAALLKESARFALSGSNVKCEFEMPNDLWAADVDAAQISRVVSNVVINADQAMPQGGRVIVSAENTEIRRRGVLPLGKGRYIKVTIQDFGIGIEKKHLGKIFEPYFTTKEKGVGLGLATAYSIIKSHGGCMTAESEFGVGTTVRIFVPACVGPVPASDEDSDERDVGTEGRIMVMDDEQVIGTLLRNGLSEAGYEVDLTSDGGEATDKYAEAIRAKRPYDAVILDLTIPGGIGGRETMLKLLEIDPGVKAIASSGYANDAVMSNFKEYGFSGVVTKPYRFSELERALSNVLHRTETGRVTPKSRTRREDTPTRMGRILVVEDAQVVITALGESLPYLGYEVEFAQDGAEAISMYGKALESGNCFDAVIVDLTVSGVLGGEKIMGRLIEMDPGIRGIVTSGHSSKPAMLNPEKFGFKARIAKPYEVQELASVISMVIGKRIG
jgi:PAS domain S-box-containing protein